MKKTLKRAISVILAVVTVFGAVSLSASTSAYGYEATTAGDYIKANTCHFCGSRFSDETVFNLHLSVCPYGEDTAPIEYFCTYCGNMYTSKKAFNSHVTGCSSKHEGNVGTVTNTCPTCGNDFSDEAVYNNHVQGCAATYACDYCKDEFRSEAVCNTHKKTCDYAPEIKYAVEIRKPSTTTITYGDSIILHADIDGKLPSGWSIEWTASNGNFSYTESADGTTCTVSPAASGDTTFTATVYDAQGVEISEDEQTMTSKAGFFLKIIAFFKKLFGLNKIIPEMIRKSI